MAQKQEILTKEAGGMQRAMPQRTLSPFDEMDRLFNRMVENFMPLSWARPGLTGFGAAERMPQVDLIDRDEDIVVRAALPGVDKEHLEVSVADNMVTINASDISAEAEEKATYYRCEIPHGSYSRTVTLPAMVDSDKAKASFKDGLLELVIPKAEKAKRHSIPIQ